MSKIKYAQIHIGDFLSGTIQMNAAEGGAYIYLILAHYQAGLRGLKDCRQTLARIAHCDPKQWDRIKDAVLGKFYLENGHWKHERVVEEITKMSRKSPVRIPPESRQNPAKKRQLSENKQNTSDITYNQKPIKKKKKNITKKPPDISQEIWDDFTRHRKSKKAPITQTALNGIAKEASRAGWPLGDALAEICARGWTGFKADWVTKGNENGKTGTNREGKSARAKQALLRSHQEITG